MGMHSKPTPAEYAQWKAAVAVVPGASRWAVCGSVLRSIQLLRFLARHVPAHVSCLGHIPPFPNQPDLRSSLHRSFPASLARPRSPGVGGSSPVSAESLSGAGWRGAVGFSARLPHLWGRLTKRPPGKPSAFHGPPEQDKARGAPSCAV